MKKTVPIPTCAGCQHDLHFFEHTQKVQHGVMMHPGEHYCTGGRKARRFKRGDPKSRVPAWCPRLKSPCEVRVYAFKSPEERAMHSFYIDSFGHDSGPQGRRYTVSAELQTKLSPREFWQCCNEKPDADLIGAEVELYGVVEIDDGIRPVFFYKTMNGYEVASYFKAEDAKKR